MTRRGKSRVSRTFKHGFEVPAGPSIRQRVQQDLDDAMSRYLDLKADAWSTNDELRAIAIARGEVRGLARALGRIMSPYYPIRGMKAAEREAYARIKGEMNYDS